MNKKGISALVIVAIVVIAVIVVGVVAYYALSGDGGEEPTPTPTPTPGIEDATSMTFDVNATVGGVQEFDKFTVKNLDTDDVWLRVDQTDAQGNSFIYIMKQADQEAWANFGEWMDVSSDWATYADNTLIGYVGLDNYLQELENWSGTGNHEFTQNGDSFEISNIFIDPDVADSVFDHT